jgi:hypothetical protein
MIAIEYRASYSENYKIGSQYIEETSATIYYYKIIKVDHINNECYSILHREDGPAIQSKNSKYHHYFYEGINYNCHSQEEFKRIINLKSFL